MGSEQRALPTPRLHVRSDRRRDRRPAIVFEDWPLGAISQAHRSAMTLLGRHQYPPVRLEALLSHLVKWPQVERRALTTMGQLTVHCRLGIAAITELVASHVAGASTREVASRYGIAKTSVINVLGRQRIKLWPRGLRY
jgi:hypothetical protein